jgi:type II secretory pathway pseudopilin PulG
MALVGVIAAVSIPSLQRMQQRARTAEAASNLAAIGIAEQAWFGEQGIFRAADPSPPGAVGSRGRPFVDASGGFHSLGWVPDGEVWFRYAVTTNGIAFTADAMADLDDDGVPQLWGYIQPDPLGATVVGVQTCAEVWLGEAPGGRRSAGPCGPDMGRSVF